MTAMQKQLPASPLFRALLVLTSSLTAAPGDGLSWSLNPEEMRVPDSPVQGHMAACPDFTPDSVRSTYRTLEFQKGGSGDCWWKISVTIPEINFTEGIENRKFKHSPVKARKDYKTPQVNLTWRSDEGSRSGSEAFVGNFAMVLETGAMADGAIPAKIYLCVPDESKSLLAGTFKITGPEGRPLLFTQLHGLLEMPPALNEKALFVGSAGLDAKAKPAAMGSHFPLTPQGEVPSGTWSRSTGSGSELKFSQANGLSYTFKGQSPGWHLLIVAAANVTKEPGMKRPAGFAEFPPIERFESLPRIYAARWVELKDARSSVKVDLTVDPALLGFVKIEVPEARNGAFVSFLPLGPDDAMKLPQVHGASSCLRVKVENGKAGSISLPEGTYEFECEGRKQAVRIQRGKTAELVLGGAI